MQQASTDNISVIGAWLFRRRTLIPIPLALAVLLIPAQSGPGPATRTVGIFMVALGESLRLWGVRHIGAVSRTRSERLGPLVASGPFAIVRNPLYLGNITLWIGFALSAQLPWLAPLFAAILAFEYHAIVRWEERLLIERVGERYREYVARVPRWIPNLGGAPTSTASLFSWRDTFHSERGTLIAIAIGYALLWLKAHDFWLAA